MIESDLVMNMKKQNVLAVYIGCIILVQSWFAIPSRAIAGEYLQSVPFTDVNITGSFWKARLETNRKITIPYIFKKCNELGLIDNFARAAGFMSPDTFEPNSNNRPSRECDVYKAIEAASYTLAKHPDTILDLYLDSLIFQIAAAQEPDGYLYPARGFLPLDKMERGGAERWTSLGRSQELYAVGHLYEAAVAHYQATGKRTLLDVALKNADLLCEVFGPDGCQSPSGHQEIEIGLPRLYRVSSSEKYLHLAEYLIDLRGRPETHKLYGLYHQDHKPVAEQDEAVGHAVRAGYMYSGMADIAMATENEDYVKILDRLWKDVVSTKIYITGGVGAQRKGEAYGQAYALGNKTAYCETCAAIANAMWNQRMFLIHGDAKYVDVVERVIYNGFLSGISLKGDRFFYTNPLASDGGHERSAWFGTPCCPTNIVRFLPSLAGYTYAWKGDSLYVNLFGGSMVETVIDGKKVCLIQETDYPWDGDIRMRIELDEAQELAIRIRIPGWARNQPIPSDLYRFAEPHTENVKLEINDSPEVQPKLEKGFAVIERRWHNGDTVHLHLPMPVRRVRSHQKVAGNHGKVALQRGPIVYCFEGVDNGGKVSNMILADDVSFQTRRIDSFGGITSIAAKAKALVRQANGATKQQEHTLTAIPYYAWAHRGGFEMQVWLPTAAADAKH